MMPAMKSVSSVVLLALFGYIATVAAAPYQELVPRPGYVPVYIRVGDTPLAEIHPKLAEAFHEIESSNLMLETDGKSPDVIVMSVDKDGAIVLMNDQLMEESKAAEVIEEVKTVEAEKKQDEAIAPPVTVVKEKETDIASFDVVKMDDAETKADKATALAAKN